MSGQTLFQYIVGIPFGMVMVGMGFYVAYQMYMLVLDVIQVIASVF